MARGIDEEPDFSWWVPYMLQKHDVIILAINSRIKKKTHKYGVEVPKSHKDTMRLDALAGDTKWEDDQKLKWAT